MRPVRPGREAASDAAPIPLAAPVTPDQILVTYTVEAGSPSEANLRLPASWNAEAPIR
ncbi:MAG: hypothetical protein ACJ72W_06025 [Actinoallomurus sp.]